MVEVQTTPWYETRSLISPQVEMLNPAGMIKYKDSFLKTESPRNATVKPRFIHYNANYVKYYFLKEFYQLLFDGVRQEVLEEGESENKVVVLLAAVVADFTEHCRERPSEENARELFRAFCKARLFKS